MDKSIAEKIRDLRKKHGLSQDEFGSRIGVSRQAVSKWELGTWPDTENLGRICKEFDVSITYFFGDDENACKKAAEELAATKNAENSALRTQLFTLKLSLIIVSLIILIIIIVALISILMPNGGDETIQINNWRLSDSITIIILLIASFLLLISLIVLAVITIRAHIKRKRDNRS